MESLRHSDIRSSGVINPVTAHFDAKALKVQHSNCGSGAGLPGGRHAQNASFFTSFSAFLSEIGENLDAGAEVSAVSESYFYNCRCQSRIL